MRRSLALALTLAFASPAAAADFPRSFTWGTAIAGFQSEMGGRPGNVDRRTDWYVWTHDAQNRRDGTVTSDRPERGPAHWNRFREDVDLAARALHQDAFRLSIEWSRIFPRSTRGVRGLRALDRRANQAAVRHYRALLRRIRARGMRPFVTLQHFTLPTWLHDPIEVRRALAGRGADDPIPSSIRRGGWLDTSTVDEFRKYADYVAAEFGDLVDVWAPINEPMVVAANGYVNVPGVLEGGFPPGVFSFSGAIRAVRNMALANDVAYRAIHRRDRRASVGPVHNMIAFTPADPSSARDVRGTEHAEYVFNRLFLNAVVRGEYDLNVNGVIEGGERLRSRRNAADFIGLNYYFRGRVTGLDASLSTSIQQLDFLPATSYRTAADPDRPPCPTMCSEFGTEIYPEGFRAVLRTAGSYRLPVVVTENGIADADDDQRRAYLVDHLRVLRDVMRAREARVTGYFHWSLFDNFEWAEGYAPKFGLYDIRRRARPTARVYARIARTGNLPR